MRTPALPPSEAQTPEFPRESAELTCAECGKAIAPEEGARTPSGERFCAICYQGLRSRMDHIAQEQARDIPYGAAIAAALAGAAVGVLAWWEMTSVIHLAFSAMAVPIGFLVAFGVRRAARGRRNRPLQAIAVSISLLGWLAGMCLVNRTYILHVLQSAGGTPTLPWIGGPRYLYHLIMANFQLLDVATAVVIVYAAGSLTRPFPRRRKAGSLI